MHTSLVSHRHLRPGWASGAFLLYPHFLERGVYGGGPTFAASRDLSPLRGAVLRGLAAFHRQLG